MDRLPLLGQRRLSRPFRQFLQPVPMDQTGQMDHSDRWGRSLPLPPWLPFHPSRRLRQFLPCHRQGLTARWGHSDLMGH